MSSRIQKIMKLVEEAKLEEANMGNSENNMNSSNLNMNLNSPKDSILSEDDVYAVQHFTPEDVEKMIQDADLIFLEETSRSSPIHQVKDRNAEKNGADDYVANNDNENSHGSSSKDDKRGSSEHEENSHQDGAGDYIPNSTGESSSESSEEESSQQKKRRIKGQNKRILNKKLRMEGKKYLGFRKPRNQRNTFHDTERKEKKLKERCECKFNAKEPTKKCSLISDDERQNIFQYFWNNMNWDQRKIYVANTVHVYETHRKKLLNEGEISRRAQTLKYHLKVGSQSIPVCKRMYLATVGIGEWSARAWAQKSEGGMGKSNEREISSREKRHDIFYEKRVILRKFLQDLNKLPSHYCRKDSDRLYLEQVFQSWSDLYRAYKIRCQEENQTPLSIVSMRKMASEEMNLSLFRPRKDQCDTCFMFKNGNILEEDYQNHILKKDLARREKERDKILALNSEAYVVTVDVQAVKLAPQIPASTLYYKQKLCCHNFTVYNLGNSHVTCYWFDESNADGQASTYASFLLDYLQEHCINLDDKKPIIIYSDGCTAQNRNSILANALLFLSEKYDISITQKFLEKGHTQMECDSVHASIETALKNKEIYLPSDYLRITKQARPKNPYCVKNPDFTFFLNFNKKELVKYTSIKPSKMKNDGNNVINIRALKYFDGKISYTLSFDREFELLPTRPKNIDFKNVTFPSLYQERLSIAKTKYDHLQVIKKTIPNDCWSFYEQLPYK